MANPYQFNPFTKKLDRVGSASGASSGAAGAVKARQGVSPSPNGVVVTFTVPDNYLADSLDVFVNGLAENSVTETSANTFTLTYAPVATDIIHCRYQIAGTVTVVSHILMEDGFVLLAENGDYLTQE